MDHRFEEDPDEEPDEPGQPAQPDGARGTATGLVPTVGLPSREWEYRTKVLSVAQVAHGGEGPAGGGRRGLGPGQRDGRGGQARNPDAQTEALSP